MTSPFERSLDIDVPEEISPFEKSLGISTPEEPKISVVDEQKSSEFLKSPIFRDTIQGRMVRSHFTGEDIFSKEKAEVPSPHGGELQIGPQMEQGLWEKFLGWFHNPTVGKDRAANIVNMSDLTGMSPTEVLRHYDELSSVFFPAQIPGSKEMAVRALQGAMTGAIAGGMMTAPIVTATTVAAFMGMDEAINAFVSWRKKEPYLFQAGRGFSDLLEAEGFSRDAINVLEFMTEAAAAGGVSKTGRGVIGALLRGAKDQVSKINLINRIAKRAKDKDIAPDDAAVDIADEVGLSKETIEEAQAAVEEVKATQRELSEKEALRRFEEKGDEIARLDLARQAEEIARAKQLKPKIGERERELRRLKKEAVVKPEPEAVAKPIADELGISYDGVQEGVKKDLHLWTDPETRGTFSTEGLSKEEVTSKLDAVRKRFETVEPITEVDLQTGTREPVTIDDAFNTSLEHAQMMKGVYEEHGKALAQDPEMFMSKLINDVNLWRNGEDVPIEKVRNGLSELSSRSEELRDYFMESETYPFNFDSWKEVVSEAAVWARKTDRLNFKQSDVTLRMGIAPEDIAKLGKDILEGARKFEKSFEKSLRAKDFKWENLPKKVRDEFTAAIVERRGNLSREVLKNLSDDGFEIVLKMYLAAGAPGRSRTHFQQLEKEVFHGLNKAKKKDLFAIIDAKRMLDIGGYKTTKQYKFPTDRDPVNAMKFLKSLKERRGYSDKEINDLMWKADAYADHIRMVIDKSRDSGIFGDQEAVDLKAHFWRKIKEIDKFDPIIKVSIKGTKFNVRESGVSALGKGKAERIIEGDAELLALEFFNRMYGRMMHNEALREWLRVARERPTNPFVWTKLEEGGKKPEGWIRFYAWEGGAEKAQRTSVYLRPEIAKDMVTSGSKDFTYRAAKAASYLLGTPVLRMMATGAAPVWSTIVNFPIDLLTAWGSARYYKDGKWHRLFSSHLPLYGFQMGRELVKVASDIHTRGPYYKALAEHGALLSFLAQQARIIAPGERLPTRISKIGDVMTRHSESMEMWTRGAVASRVIRMMAKEEGISYEEAMKSKKIMDRAAFASRDYIDFNQGGWLIKAIDQILPYTNAGTQAGRVFWRQAKEDPVGFAYRMFQVGSLAGLTTAVGWMNNPKTQSEIPLYDRAKNKTFSLPDSFRFTDLEGVERGLYVKVPLPREIAMFNIFFETLMDQYLYSTGVIKYEPEYEGVFQAMKAGMPVDPTGLPPLAGAIHSYKTGIDMFTGKPATTEMLPYPQSRAEYTPGKIGQAWVDIGEKTKLSPDRLKVALRQMFTDSLWGRLVGTGYEKVFSDLPDDMKQDNLFITLSRIPRIGRIIGVTSPNARTREKEYEIVSEDKMQNMIDGRAAEAWAKFAYWRDSKAALKEIDTLKEKVLERDYYAWERINDRIEVVKNSASLSDRESWLSLSKKPPESRAKILALRYNKSDKEGKEKIWAGLSAMEGVGGMVSDRFIEEFTKLIED